MSALLSTTSRGIAPWSARHALLALVLVALVCAQALGFMHRVVHLPHAAVPAAAVASAADHQEDDAGAHVHGDWLHALFTAHDDASGCRLYDGLGHHADLLPLLPAVAPLLPAAGYLRLLCGDFVARWAALFDARGPPLSR